jgi:hypothetical protein
MRALILSLLLAWPAVAADSAPEEIAGYGAARWGMTARQVVAAEKGAKRVHGEVVRSAKVAGASTLILYTFSEGRLVRVSFMFEGKDATTERHEALSTALTKKYGAGRVHDDSARDTHYTEWSMPKTNVSLLFERKHAIYLAQTILVTYEDPSFKKPLPTVGDDDI